MRNFVFPIFPVNPVYEGVYLLGTSIARLPISKHPVEIAKKTNANAIPHRATGKGNDQVRFEFSAYALNPDIKIIAPWRDWNFKSQTDLIEFAHAHQILLEKDKQGEASFSVYANLLHSSSEEKILEDPAVSASEYVHICVLFHQKFTRSSNHNHDCLKKEMLFQLMEKFYLLWIC